MDISLYLRRASVKFGLFQKTIRRRALLAETRKANTFLLAVFSLIIFNTQIEINVEKYPSSYFSTKVILRFIFDRLISHIFY